MQSRAALRSVQVDSSMDGLQMIELYNASSLLFHANPIYEFHPLTLAYLHTLRRSSVDGTNTGLQMLRDVAR
jgi:hypothetical protein